jgi:tetratricopeptide (TPR) repeat protein
MKRLVILFTFSVCFFTAETQTPDAKELHETAKTFMRQGDFANASLVLNKALQQEPANFEISKDLALTYYYQKDLPKALNTIKTLIDREEADDQCFQIAANIYKSLGQSKECEKLYKKGLKKFPKSGALYSEYGELLLAMNDNSAIKQWEKGIETDAGYSGNYYNAARYYYVNNDKLWTVLYGEIFLNIELLTARTAEIKSIVMDSYKKIFAEDILANSKNKNGFEQAFLQTLSKQNVIVSSGLNPETLTMVRTRFILDWYNNFSTKFPFRLFDYHLQLLKEGMFNAYNQWIFGPVQNLVAFQDWTAANSSEYNEFQKFQRGRIFKMQPQQYYHK